MQLPGPAVGPVSGLVIPNVRVVSVMPGLASARLSDQWEIRAGLFRSENRVALNLVELYRNVQRDGSAQRQLVATRNQGAVDQLFGLILVNMYFVLPQFGTGSVYGLSTLG